MSSSARRQRRSSSSSSRHAQSAPDQVTPDHVTPDQVTPDQVTPDHVTPDQVTPDQVTPDHVTPLQVTPDHVTPLQVTPDHVTPLQVTPDQVTPDHVTPDHVTPDQVTPASAGSPDFVASSTISACCAAGSSATASACSVTGSSAMAASCSVACWSVISATPAASVSALDWAMGCPATSTSPVTFSPPTSTTTDPRAASSEPAPVERAYVCTAFTGVAAFIAAVRLMRPAPCCRAVARGRFLAVPMSRALTWSGVRSGRCEISSAAAPETTAVACEVPLPRNNRSPIRPAGCSWSRNEFGLRRLTTCSPGATTSGLRVPSPSFENAEVTSSAGSAVPLASSLPTAMTYGSVAGLLTFPVPKPSLPTATTTTMPLCQACSAA